jgi:PAS domain S-box-containing protein
MDGVQYADGILFDITARKRAEESLKLFRMLIDQSNDAIQVVDPETLRYLDVNEKACSSLGYTREELLSLYVSDIDLSESSWKKVKDELQNSEFTLTEGRFNVPGGDQHEMRPTGPQIRGLRYPRHHGAQAGATGVGERQEVRRGREQR